MLDSNASQTSDAETGSQRPSHSGMWSRISDQVIVYMALGVIAIAALVAFWGVIEITRTQLVYL